MDAQTPKSGASFRIGDYLVDPARGLVAGEGGETHLEPKVMDVLCLLAARRGRVVSRADLVDSIWKVNFGADESLSRAVSILRKSFGGRPYIETIPKRGYRLTAPVSEDRDREQTVQVKALTARPLRRLVPALIVLAALTVAAGGIAAWQLTTAVADGRVEVRPFRLPAGDADARRVGSGLSDLLRRTLAKCGVEVAPVPAKGPEREAGEPAELVLTGSVEQQPPGRYLVTVHVADRENRVRLWSSQYQRGGDQADALRGVVANTVAGVLQCGLAKRAPYAADMTTDVFALLLEVCSLMRENHKLARTCPPRQDPSSGYARGRGFAS